MTDPNTPLKTFIARFEHDHGYSEAEIVAPDEAQALAIARTLGPDDYAFVAHYDVDRYQVEHIEIEEAD